MFQKDGSEAKKVSPMYSSMHGGKPCVAVDITNLTSNRVGARYHCHNLEAICLYLRKLLVNALLKLYLASKLIIFYSD